MTTHRQRFVGVYDDEFYWERVNRNLGWLGNTLEEQHERQKKLRDSVIGIVGTGGIGGAVAARLVRMGALNLKLADPDDFDLTNVQRQYGATRDTVGRNKAEVVAEAVYGLTGDCTIDVFPEGITPDTAEEFMDGCDYVMDQMEFFQIKTVMHCTGHFAPLIVANLCSKFQRLRIQRSFSPILRILCQ